jgi:undecaprenyl phosphate-alpha-L-ara4FN deformylase
MREDALNVHTLHAETEGIGQLEVFIALVEALKARGAQFVRLGDVAAQLEQIELPVCEVIRTTLSGRSGWVSTQGPTAV